MYLSFQTAKQDALIMAYMSGRLRGTVDRFRCISDGVDIGESEVDIFASWSAVSSPGILLRASVHKNVIVLPEVSKE